MPAVYIVLCSEIKLELNKIFLRDDRSVDNDYKLKKGYFPIDGSDCFQLLYYYETDDLELVTYIRMKYGTSLYYSELVDILE